MSELEGTGRSGCGRSVLSTGTRVLAGSSVARRVKGPLASPGPAEWCSAPSTWGPSVQKTDPQEKLLLIRAPLHASYKRLSGFSYRVNNVMVMSTGTNGQLGGSKKQKSVII